MTGRITDLSVTTHNQPRALTTRSHSGKPFLWLLILALLGLSLGLGLLSNYQIFNPFARNTTTGIAAIKPTENLRRQHALNVLEMGFEQNAGQIDSNVAYFTRTPGYSLFIRPHGAIIRLDEPHNGIDANSPAAFDIHFVNADPKSKLEGVNQLKGRINYLRGRDHWQRNIRRFQQVRATGIYPGIDLVYYGNRNLNLEYDFQVAPGADPEQILIRYQGVDNISLDKDGHLDINLANGKIRQRKPTIYQIVNGQRQPVDGRYIKTDSHTIGIQVAAYDEDLPLIIDPVLEYASYLGGNKDDAGLAVTVDDEGFIYVSGHTKSLNFPTETPLQTDSQGSSDIFVAKLTPAGDALVFATYIGGDKRDQTNAIAVDDSGHIYVAGVTLSNNDFPLLNAQQNIFGSGKEDGFALKLTADGSSLVYSTYIGGSGKDSVNGLAVDGNYNAYLAGMTLSGADFPLGNALFNTPLGEADGFFMKLDAAGNKQYASLLSGAKDDIVTGIALDEVGNLYLSGYTHSLLDFPLHKPWQNTYGGGAWDGFITAISTAGDHLLYSSYLGGAKNDMAQAIAVDAAGHATITGSTFSPSDFPLLDAWQPVYSGMGDAFVAGFDNAGQLNHATYLGGADEDAGTAIELDDDYGTVTITGHTQSENDFPLLKAVQTTLGGGTDAFIARLDQTGSLVFATYLGGDKDDRGNAIANDHQGGVTLAGSTQSQSTLPLLNPLQPVIGGAQDVYLAGVYINTAPQIISQPVKEAVEETAYQYTVVSEDVDGDPLSYVLLTAPADMEIDPDTGIINWPIPLIGVYPVLFRVSDDMGAYTDQTYTLTVIPNNQPPQILSQPVTAAIVDQAYQYAINAVDPNADPIRYQLNQAPLGMHIDPVGGLIEWQPVATGDYPVEIQVSDTNATHTLQNYTLTVGNNPDNLPPLFEPLTDQTVPLGTKLSLNLIASDPENQPLTYSVTPLPLPDGADLDTRTGLFTFKPGPGQTGEWVFTYSVSDGRHLVSRTITITVPTADPNAPTRMIGRVVDSTALARGLELPIVGATVSFLETDVETVTDANGEFILTGLPEGIFVFSIDSSTANPAPGGAGYASFRVEMPLIAHSDNIIPRPFSLPRISTGSLTQINPVQAAVVNNPEIGVSLSIPTNTALNTDGSQFTGQLSISEVPPGLAPGSMPDWLQPALLITIQPLGVTFATPVPITFPNIDGLPAGTETDIWSLNPDTGEFIIVGTGRVSADGQRIETISGGVRQSDWHAAVQRQSDSPDEPKTVNPDNECGCPEKDSGSTVSLREGRMKTQFTLPAYRSLETRRALTFIYQSHQARPMPVIPFNISLPARTAIPNTISYELTVAGLKQGQETFISTSGLSAGVTLRSALAFDASEFATGMYPYQRRATSNYNVSSIGRIDNGDILVMNEQISPFGAGWMLQGLYRLVLNADASVLLVSPSGRPINYRPGGVADVFTAPDNDFAQLVRNPDGSYTHTEKDGVKMHFDADGLMTAHEDRNHNITSYQYDEDGKLLTLTDPVGLITTLDYVNGKLNTVADPAGRVTRFQHDAAGNLTRATYPDNSFIQHQYDDRHLMLTRIDERGNAYQHRYDAFGRLIDATLPDGTLRASVSQTSAGLVDIESGIGTQANPAPLTLAQDAKADYVDGRGNLSTQTLDPHGRALTQIDEIGRITTTVRDTDSNPIQTTRPNNSVVTRTFDDFGNVLTKTEQFNGALYQYGYDNFSLATSYTNPKNHTTTINRDPDNGNPETIVNHLGHTTTLEYDIRGLVERQLSPNGLETIYTYNTQGLMETQTETPPAGSPGNVRLTQYSYHPTGLLKQVITSDNITLNYEYDDRSYLRSVTDNLGQSIAYTYDDHKNIVQTDTTSSDGSLALTVASVYDNRNRLKQTLGPHSDSEDSVTERLLDNNSNLTGLIDPNENDSSNQYDPFNRLTQNTHRLNGVTTYEYDLLDRITKITAPNGVVTEYKNDLIGRRIKEISPDRGALSYQYDKANNLIAKTDGRGITSNYLYDELERVKTKTYPNTLTDKDENVSYTYDNCPFGIGRLCDRNDESGSYQYQYDAYGNLTQMHFTETAGTLYTMAYIYDDGDHVIQTTYPSGRVIDIQRDGVRRIESIDSRTDLNAVPQTILNNIQYRGDNQMTRCTNGNGLIDERQYDLQGRLRHQLLKNGLNVVIDERTYQYDKNSNIINRAATPQNSQYQYDALDRLIQESQDQLPINDYYYDLNDNRLRKNSKNQVETYQYQENSNRLDYTDALDGSGQTLPGKPQREMIYNDAGRLFQLIEDGLLKGEYLYNDQGQRTRKTVYNNDGSVNAITIYHYNQKETLISETKEDGQPVKDYIHANGQPVAQIDNGGATETIHYLYTDHLYTPRLATNQNQAVTWRWEGEAFGETEALSFGAVVNLRFPGQYFDFETELHYNYYRYYDPDTGRYITSDPIGLDGGLNTYGYVLQNPLILNDPEGLDVWVENTTSVYGFHRRVCVDTPNGPYCVSFGMYDPKMSQDGSSDTSSCDCTPTQGGQGSGMVYEDNVDPATKEVVRRKTKPQEDNKIYQFLNSQVGNIGLYNVLFNSCRDFSISTFVEIENRILFKQTSRGRKRRR